MSTLLPQDGPGVGNKTVCSTEWGDSRHVSRLMDARTHSCANVDSDHFPLVSRIRARISSVKKFLGEKVEKYDYEKKKTLPEKQVEYKTNFN